MRAQSRHSRPLRVSTRSTDEKGRAVQTFRHRCDIRTIEGMSSQERREEPVADAGSGRVAQTASARRGAQFWWGLLAIVVLTAIWGYCNIVIRQLEFSLNPARILVIRYLFVGVAGLPWLVRGPRPSLKRLLQGLGVGMILAAATLSQALGMESIPVDNVAFITALYVVLTPLAMTLWRRRWPHRIVVGAALASLLGVALLVGHLTLTVAAGTFWSLLAALWATLQIIGTAELSRVMTTIQLTIVEALGAGLTLAAYLLIQSFLHPPGLSAWSWHLSATVWWGLGFLAILGTLVAGWLQVWGQRRVTATEAALAFNLEPIFTALFAWLVLSEWLRWLQVAGALLIIASLAAMAATGEETAALPVPDAQVPYREH